MSQIFRHVSVEDAGYKAIAGQIEVFGKLSVLAVSAPILIAFWRRCPRFSEPCLLNASSARSTKRRVRGMLMSVGVNSH